MTRISNLILASTLAILPISAFAQQTAAPVRAATPTGMTAPDQTAPGATVTNKTAADRTVPEKIGTDKTTADRATIGKADAAGTTTTKTQLPNTTANTTQPATPDATTPVHAAKSEVHSMKNGTTHHAKASNSTKTVEPAKS